MKTPATNAHFQALLDAEAEPLVLTIKAHHSIDSLLDEALHVRMPHAKELDLRRVSFLLKVDFLVGLGVMRKQLRPLFDKANSVRNRFAHDPHTEIDASDAGKLKQLLLSQRPKVVQPEFAHTDSPLEILRMLFAVCYINLLAAYEDMVRRDVENIVSMQLAHEAVTRGAQQASPKTSVHDEFARRYAAFMERRHPGIALKRQ